MSITRRWRFAAVALAVTFHSAAWCAPPEATAPAETVVLDANAVWHCWLGWRTVQIARSDGQLVTLWDGKEKKNRPLSASQPPPANWFAADFDDSAWARSAGPFAINAWSQSYVDILGPGNPGEVAMICIRGKFRIDDPAAGRGMKLLVDYHGGMIAYLNGSELSRSHLPPGQVNFDTPATTYPDEVYLRPDGKRLTERDGKEFPEPYAKRVRHAELAIPAERLVKGTNVLAIAVFRAPTAEVYMTAPTLGPAWPGPTTPWPHAKIVNVKLSAPPQAAGRIQSATRRQPGVRLWNRSVLEPTDPTDFDDPLDKLAPIRIAGCRNGSFSGMVVVSSDAAIANLSAKAGELRQADGGGVIPASAVRVRFAVPDGMPYQWYNHPPLMCDSLLDAPPNPVPVADKRGGAICPVWLTVGVPPDAPPGEYAGKLTVSADGLPATAVPVRLTVVAWPAPDPKDFRVHNLGFNSPESLARHYNVPLWSDRHFELIGKTLALAAEIGSRQVLVDMTIDFYGLGGNQESVVRWIPQADGGYKHDFAAFDKYLQVVADKVGKPLPLRLNCWGEYRPGWKSDGSGRKVSKLDPATGKVEPMDQPPLGSPESLAFWKPVLQEVRRKVEARGWVDVTVFGHNSYNAPPNPNIVGVCHAIWPDGGWGYTAHNGTLSMNLPTPDKKATMPVRFSECVWTRGNLTPRGYTALLQPRPAVWCWSYRSIMRDYSPLTLLRGVAEGAILRGHDGVGQMGLDIFPVAVTNNRPVWINTDRGGLGPDNSTLAILAAGDAGPIPTERYEMFREGVQLAEAILFLQRAVAEKKLPADMEKPVADCLDQRDTAYIWQWSTGRAERDARLLELAGELAGRLAAK